MTSVYDQQGVAIHHGDSLDVLRTLPDNSVDAVVTDPPYALGFMGQKWDTHTPGGFQHWCELWSAECLRVLKPGGHLLAFGGTRTYHRLTSGIEDAGFEIRDSLHWIYGSGFPKSLDVSKAIDKAAGAEREVVGVSPYASLRGGNTGGEFRQRTSSFDRDDRGTNITAPATDSAKEWAGYGTALKPAHEPIVLARKPLSGTVASNVLQYGTGALNVDGCRVRTSDTLSRNNGARPNGGTYNSGEWQPGTFGTGDQAGGRWPANVLLDDVAAEMLDEQSRFFPVFRYTAKADANERPLVVNGVRHPTVKPLDLMRWLVRLVTPAGGTVLEPFAGSGTTVEACLLEGFGCVAIEREVDYLPLIRQRIDRHRGPAAYLESRGETEGTLFGLEEEAS